MPKQGMVIQTRKGGRYEVGSDDEDAQVNIESFGNNVETHRNASLLKNPKSKIPNPNEIPNPKTQTKEEDAKGVDDAA